MILWLIRSRICTDIASQQLTLIAQDDFVVLYGDAILDFEALQESLSCEVKISKEHAVLRCVTQHSEALSTRADVTHLLQQASKSVTL